MHLNCFVRRLLPGLLGLSCSLTPVAAAPARDSPTDEIIVSAPSVDPDVLRKQVAEFSRAITDTVGQEQFSRREETFCPKVIGLDPRYEAIVLQKFANAAAATGKLKQAGSASCQTDTLVVFTDDGDRLADDLKAKNAAIFAHLSREKVAEIFNSHRAVRWWYGVTMKGAHGEPMIDGTIHRADASLISSGIKISLATTVVLVDVTQAEGFPLDSIASFAAMVSFAQIRGDEGMVADLPSILGIFRRRESKSDAYLDITTWDKAYLWAIYHISPDRPLWQQRYRLMAAMTEALDPRHK